MGILIPDEFIPNGTDNKVADAAYIQYTDPSNAVRSQEAFNDSILGGTIYKTINGQSIIAETGDTNIYTSTDSYVTCSSSEDASIKVITIENYQQVNGGNIRIKFTYANTLTPESPSVIKLRINTKEDGSTYVEGNLYYNGNPVTGSNSWSEGETVAVYYDGTNYMANNVKGVNLKTSSIRDLSNADDTIATTEKAVATLKGNSTDSMSALTLYGLQANINDLRSASATTGMTLDGSSSESFARFTNVTQTITIVGTCSTSATMTLRQNGEIVGTNTGVSCTFTVQVSPSVATSYTFNMTYSVGSVKSRTKYVYYVYPIYYGTFDNSITYTTDQLLGLNGETRLLTTFTSEINRTPTRSAKQSYPTYFDDTDRRVYIAVPTTGIASGYNINTSNVWLGSTTDPAKKYLYFSKISDSTEEATTGYQIYASATDHPINPGVAGVINFICN